MPDRGPNRRLVQKNQKRKLIANISATPLNGGIQSAALTTTPRAGVASLALNPTSVLGGSTNSTAAVTLNAPAAGVGAPKTRAGAQDTEPHANRALGARGG